MIITSGILLVLFFAFCVFVAIPAAYRSREKNTLRYGEYCGDMLVYKSANIVHEFMSFEDWKKVKKVDIDVSFFFDTVLKLPLRVVPSKSHSSSSGAMVVMELTTVDFPIQIKLRSHYKTLRFGADRWDGDMAKLEYVAATDGSWKLSLERKHMPFFPAFALVSQKYFVSGDIDQFQDDMIKLRLIL